MITSDMGANEAVTTGCPGRGDDALLLTTPANPVGCDASYPRIHTYTPGESSSAFAADVGCVAEVGTIGCGYEQQLEAVLKALVPASSTMRFYDGDLGQGDQENDGLLRGDSLLVVVVLSDEDDCSTHDTELFNRTSAVYGGTDINYRCYGHPDVLFDVDRFSSNLMGLRDEASDVVYATLTGIPAGPSTSDLPAILGHPMMQYRPDAEGDEPIPACVRGDDDGAAPGRRLVEMALQVETAGGTAVVDSICATDYVPFMRRVARRVFEQLDVRSCESP